MSETINIDEIRIEDRHRKDMGDIAVLAASIEEVGLLHPVVVRWDGTLISGERRLLAAKLLGWTRIPITRVDLDALARGEFAENAMRKDFTLSEAVAIKRALEPEERAAAQERMHAGKPSEKFSKPNGRALDKVAIVVGKHRTTIVKAEAIVDAAEAEPVLFGKLKKDMDRTGRVDGPFKRLKVMRQSEQIRAEPPPLPNRGPYRVIVADPPWPYEVRNENPSDRATHPYPQMSVEKICGMGEQVRAIAHNDCILWLWTTNHHMREAYRVLDAWGFDAKTILTWEKDRFGRGDWLRGQTEHCLLAVRGKPIVRLTNQTTILHGPMRANSQKPEEFYAFVERLCPAPRYAELFSRRERENWDGHGDEYAAQGKGRERGPAPDGSPGESVENAQRRSEDRVDARVNAEQTCEAHKPDHERAAKAAKVDSGTAKQHDTEARKTIAELTGQLTDAQARIVELEKWAACSGNAKVSASEVARMVKGFVHPDKAPAAAKPYMHSLFIDVSEYLDRQAKTEKGERLRQEDWERRRREVREAKSRRSKEAWARKKAQEGGR